MVLLITYDLIKPGQNYEPLYEEIKTAGTWWHHLDSVWLIDTQYSSQYWYQKLEKYLDTNDHIFIVRITSDYYGYLPKRAWDWLKGRNF